MSRCPHCEAEIEDGARFCGACGQPISPTAISQRALVAKLRLGAAAETIKVSPPPKGSSSSGSSPASAPAASSQPAANPYASLPASAAVVSSTPNVVAAPAAAPARPAV